MSTIYKVGQRNPVFTTEPREFGVAHAFATIVDSGEDGDYYIAPIGFDPLDGADWHNESFVEQMSCMGGWLVIAMRRGLIEHMWPLSFRYLAEGTENFGGFVEADEEAA